MRKWIFFGLFSFCLLFLFPKIAAISFGKRYIENYLEKQLGGRVTIKKLSLHPFTEQKCFDIQWTSPSGLHLIAEEVVIQAGIFHSFIRKPILIQVIKAKSVAPFQLSLLKKKKIALDFSPIEASIQKGVIHFKTVEVTLNHSFKVLSRGKIDLDQDHMDIVLGFPTEALQKIFKIKEVPSDYLLEIPISGKLNKRFFEKALVQFFLRNYATVTSLQR